MFICSSFGSRDYEPNTNVLSDRLSDTLSDTRIIVVQSHLSTILVPKIAIIRISFIRQAVQLF